ncbi:hypothetical protein F2P56_006447 [Juglans regia]|uniref:Uncharacterized protein n=2 Tax=Juglans regia TaxID=51240 RepID=A0A834D3F5_JUGRE|nr:uncharacterized protein LOC109017890 [Juglans regia]KAF5474558.1 hypothetical protein F2P56_006447 [Juglans regia]
MDAEEVMKLFDSCWFGVEIFEKQPNLHDSSSFEAIPENQIQGKPKKPELLRIPTLHKRSMSDQLSSKASFDDGSLSPDSVLLMSKLQTILSAGKEVTEPEETIPTDFEASSKKKVTSSGRRKRGETKSLSDLEFEELKGFIDLGFVFSEEDRNSSLASLIPGLQRFGNKGGEEEPVDETATSRPYLSEAWEVLDRRNAENPLMNWKIPALTNEIDMKDGLKWWAHTVASTVR